VSGLTAEVSVMKKRQKLLADEQCELLEPLFPEAAARWPWASNRACFEGICGFCRPVRPGGFCQNIFFPRLRLIGDGCGNGGKRKECGECFPVENLPPTHEYVFSYLSYGNLQPCVRMAEIASFAHTPLKEAAFVVPRAGVKQRIPRIQYYT